MGKASWLSKRMGWCMKVDSGRGSSTEKGSSILEKIRKVGQRSTVENLVKVKLVERGCGIMVMGKGIRVISARA